MRVELVCVALAALAASFPSLSDGAPLQVLSAPNLLRVGSKENVFVEIQDQSGGPVSVTIMIKDHPRKSRELVKKQVVLNSANNFQGLVDVFIPEGDYKNEDPRQKQYVYLQAQFPDRTLEKVVLLSFQAGYIFIQTDKPLYTPGSTVHFRALAVTPNLEPLARDQFQGHKDTSIFIEIMTPENITIFRETVIPEMGMKSGLYKLPEIASFGVWKVVSRFQSTPQKTFFAEFEVKEYVLPSFEVKLNAEKPFFYVDDEELIVDIKATYLFGKEVNGVAYVVFGVHTDTEKKSFPDSLQRVEISVGEGKATLKRAHITQTCRDINELVGHSIYVAVSVLTESGGEMVEAEKRGIQIVTSPYTIHFKKTSKYFKPGMPFNIMVYVTNPDQTPAVKVPLVVTPGSVDVVTNDNGEATVTVNSKGGDSNLPINVKTKDIDLLDNRQASASMTALPYKTNTNNLLHIAVDSNMLALDDNMKVDLNIAGQLALANIDITYMILSKGQLVQVDRFKKQGQQLISLSKQITKEMLPSFRIVAYYHVGASEVVSDSVWVDVKVSCMGKLGVKVTKEQNTYQPRYKYSLKITGDPGARVGLVAVDKGISVLNKKHRLTQSKVWDIVEKHDTGCTVGSGKDSMGVFYDAGLVFVTSATATGIRSEPNCPVVSRKKRAITLMEVRSSLASNFTGELQRACCMDGMKDNYLGYTCKRRSEYITDGPLCVQAFLSCCEKLETKKKEQKLEALQLARSDDDDAFYIGADDITSRSKFPESWLWKDETLPNCPGGKRCDHQSKDISIIMPDSITTWEIFAVSLSKNYGVCVTEPYNMIVLKNFFIDLRLPYSAVYNEQLEIKAVLHNYQQDHIKVRLELLENVDICSSASSHGRYRKVVEVEAESTLVVPFVIIPMKQGDQDIEIKASVFDSGLSDGIRKTLRVVPPGELVKEPIIIELEPKGAQVEKQVFSGIPKNQIPDTPSSTEISVTAGEQISVLVENAISGNSMGSLIVQPGGCGEQNMIYMTLPVIATTYLDRTNQWGEAVGLEKRDTAINYINIGYQRQLGYRKSDGSYAAWILRPSSTWLTAYVAKVFAMSSQLVTIEDNVLCGAIKWLILNAQQPDGTFKETTQVIHGEMTGDVAGLDTDVSMTAFVLISMQEARSLCEATINSMPGSMDKAVAYLEKRMQSLRNPYAVAMASYALANVGKLNKDLLFKFAPELNHWPVPRGYMYTLEATAYALLALVKVEAQEEAGPIVRWLNQQKKVGGGYGSTQSTIMVYQAVSEYWANAKDKKDFEMQVDLLISGRSKPVQYTINTNNQFYTRSTKAQSNENLTVRATGTGRATLTVVTLYYAQLEETASDCTSFDLKVDLVLQDKVTYEGACATYMLQIEILYKNEERDATMSILDIGLLTGFIVDTRDLAQLKNGRDRYIEKFEMDKALSARGSLIIYLDKVSHKQSDKVNFRIHQLDKVGVLQPGTVTVYEYYEPNRCRKFYHPEREDGGLLRLCEEDNKSICKCAEENCGEQKLDETDDSRKAKACEVTLKSKTDYVYKATVLDIAKTRTTDKYTLRIEEVIKEGTDRNVQGELRVFIGFSYCRDSLGLKKGRSYLLMGQFKDMYKSGGSNAHYHYVLGEQMWVEYWPTPEQCQTDDYRELCTGLESLVDDQRFKGCLQK